MNKLICGALHCVNNVGSFCTTRVITINGILAGESGDTQCGTYGEKKLTKAIKNMTNLNIGAALEQSFSNEEIIISPEIYCDAKNCTFNNNSRCACSNVIISIEELNPSKGPYCGSFQIRY